MATVADMWDVILIFIVVITTIWVFVDAVKNGLSFFWGIGCILLWLIIFPCYLGRRSSKVQDGVSTFMWVLWIFVLIKVIFDIIQLMQAMQ